jgi:hypothetical protein
MKSPTQATDRSSSAPVPSSALLAAAIFGLTALGACSDSSATSEPDPANCDTTSTTTAQGGTGGASATTTAATTTAATTSTSGTGGAGTGGSGGGSGGGGGGAPDDKIISETEGDRTFADVEAECDARGGFVQITAACAGMNSCAGFSYGDWDPGVTTEHSCAGVNGCNGISCVILPEDSGKSGQEVYEEALLETGPRSCSNCHAIWNDDGPDMAKFKLWVLPESTRTAENWLEMTPEKQARIVAFGKRGMYDDGISYANMQAYHKIYSRAEIERVVDYIRNHTEVVIATIKTHD